ncbi:MAG: hypothetical protein ACE5IA_06770 [Dehalococcoidia bacterium]
MMPQYLVQWTIYAQRVVGAQGEAEAISKALEIGPDPEGSVVSDLEPPGARPIDEDGEKGG